MDGVGCCLRSSLKTRSNGGRLFSRCSVIHSLVVPIPSPEQGVSESMHRFDGVPKAPGFVYCERITFGSSGMPPTMRFHFAHLLEIPMRPASSNASNPIVEVVT